MCSTASSATGAGSSTSPADQPNAADHHPLHLTRRALLASTAALPALAAVPSLTAADPLPVERGEPFDDGSYFDDGYGWVD